MARLRSWFTRSSDIPSACASLSRRVVPRLIEFTRALRARRDAEGLSGNVGRVNATEMTDALVQINDRLARASKASGFEMAVFHCECGECLADDVRLSLDEHEEIRAREDLLFAPGHDAQRG